MVLRKQTALRAALSLAITTSATALSAQKSREISLGPSSPWHVALENGVCRLVRTFGDGANKHVLQIQQWGPDNSIGLMLTGPTLEVIDEDKPARIHFSEKLEFDDIAFSRASEPNDETSLYAVVRLAERDDREEKKQLEEISAPVPPPSGLNSLPIDLIDSVTSVSVIQRDTTLEMRTGSLTDPFKVMNVCSEELLKGWGLNVAAHKTASRRVLITNFDEIYGRFYANRPDNTYHTKGDVLVRVKVSAAGEMSDCTVIYADELTKLSRPSCNSLARADFEPALDAAGKPMDSFHIFHVKYR